MGIMLHISDSTEAAFEKIYEAMREGEYDDLIIETLHNEYDRNENKTLTDLLDSVAQSILDNDIDISYYTQQDYKEEEADYTLRCLADK